MYEALYRKYRPRTFDEVVGQDTITETLKNQVRTGRLSHAYLFIGTRGTGKTTCARILAKAVNCEHPVDGNPCNQCPSCRGIDDGTVMDVVELDAASNNGVDDVRMLRDEAVFSPTTVRKRVYIIDEVHMLSKPAFNALLKILEEPPRHLMFILATTELNKVLPTILSRCQRHSFKRLDSETIARRLLYVAGQEGLELDEDAARLLGRLADGGMRDGLSLLDQCAASSRIDSAAVLSAMGLAGSYRMQQLSASIAQHDISSALSQYEALWQDGKDPAGLLSELAVYFRDVLLLRLAPGGGRTLVSGAYDESAMRDLDLNDSDLLRLLNTLQKYQSGMSSSANPRLQGELCLVEMCGVYVPPAPEYRPFPAKKKGPDGKRDNTPIRETVSHRDTIPEENIVPAEEEAPKEEVQKEEIREPVSIPSEQTPVPPLTAEEAGSGELWKQVLEDVGANPLLKAAHVIMSDPAYVTGTVIGTELILRIVPGFETNMVTQPDVINKIRQSATRLAGHPVQVRIEEKISKPEINTDKLDKLGQFSNVTIRQRRADKNGKGISRKQLWK